jgi:hypothetical protein
MNLLWDKGLASAPRAPEDREEHHADQGRDRVSSEGGCARAELKKMLSDISATHGPQAPGFLGSTVYKVLDSPDGRVEIADWDSADA